MFSPQRLPGGGGFLAVMRQECKAEHSLSSSVEGNNA
jgi:hypothetical protein